LGADDYLDLSNLEEVKASGKRFHMIMNTISADFDLNAYNSMLKIHGT
jgi:D-arabinose 1-dehydrogenase-like Zn-dependent alcohol dehydrogenase